MNIVLFTIVNSKQGPDPNKVAEYFMLPMQQHFAGI